MHFRWHTRHFLPNLTRKACVAVLCCLINQLWHLLYASLWFCSLFSNKPSPLSSPKTLFYLRKGWKYNTAACFWFCAKIPFHTHVRFLSAWQLCRQCTFPSGHQWRKNIGQCVIISVPCHQANRVYSVGKGNGSGKMHSIVLYTYFQWSIALIGYQYTQRVLLAIRGLWKDAVCMCHCFSRMFSSSAGKEPWLLAVWLRYLREAGTKWQHINLNSLVTCLLSSGLPPSFLRTRGLLMTPSRGDRLPLPKPKGVTTTSCHGSQTISQTVSPPGGTGCLQLATESRESMAQRERWT